MITSVCCVLADYDAASSIGRSIYDLTEDLQVIKTMMRQYLDSVYSSTLPRMIAVEGQVNLDDLLDGSAGGIIRARQPGMVQRITGASVGGEIGR